MADFLDKTVFDLPIDATCRLIANASYIIAVKEGSKASFEKLELSQAAGRIETKLILNIDGQSQTIYDPRFKFDSKTNRIFVGDVYFQFYNEKKVDFCSLKDFLTSD